MRKLFHWLLMLINLGAALLLAGGFLSRYIPPEKAWPLAFLGLVFPALVLVNLLFLAFWLIRFKKPFWISLLALVIVYPALTSTLQIFRKEKLPAPVEQVSVMSYNVRLFDVFQWSGQENTGEDLLRFAGESGTDVLCFQEFMTNQSSALNLTRIKNMLPDNPYAYVDYNYQAYQRKHGLAIFSRYPVLSGEKGQFPGTRNMYIYADILFPFDTVRVINAHLESIHLNTRQYNLIDSLQVNQGNWQEIYRIVSNIREAFSKRAEQVALLKQEVANSPHPVILLGDFNDTPVSFAYQQLRKGLKDSFIESGHGLGTTYKQFLLPLRIDYLLHSSDLHAAAHEVLDVGFSDHKPVRASFSPGD